jgi:peroxidase
MARAAHGGGGMGLLARAALVAFVALVGVGGGARAQLRQNYYGSTCPNAESTVRSVISQHLQQSFAVGPGTLRLFFHDCFVRVRPLSRSRSLGVLGVHLLGVCVCRGVTRR